MEAGLERGGGGPRDGGSAEAPEREEIRFVGLEGEDELFSAADAVGVAELGGSEGGGWDGVGSWVGHRGVSG